MRYEIGYCSMISVGVLEEIKNKKLKNQVSFYLLIKEKNFIKEKIKILIKDSWTWLDGHKFTKKAKP